MRTPSSSSHVRYRLTHGCVKDRASTASPTCLHDAGRTNHLFSTTSTRRSISCCRIQPGATPPTRPSGPRGSDARRGCRTGSRATTTRLSGRVNNRSSGTTLRAEGVISAKAVIAVTHARVRGRSERTTAFMAVTVSHAAAMHKNGSTGMMSRTISRTLCFCRLRASRASSASDQASKSTACARCDDCVDQLPAMMASGGGAPTKFQRTSNPRSRRSLTSTSRRCRRLTHVSILIRVSAGTRT